MECQCDHLSVFAAQGESDDRTGYNLAFFIVFFVCLVSFLSLRRCSHQQEIIPTLIITSIAAMKRKMVAREQQLGE